MSSEHYPQSPLSGQYLKRTPEDSLDIFLNFDSAASKKEFSPKTCPRFETSTKLHSRPHSPASAANRDLPRSMSVDAGLPHAGLDRVAFPRIERKGP